MGLDIIFRAIFGGEIFFEMIDNQYLVKSTIIELHPIQ